ncbi:hypothetical protein FHS96_005577 [Sphingomonas zeicaulis]|uniref:hypothetical protein n=1 Tax=Sphingomonas zeicaulis TaxID=1632740 RepID=UPI003D218715
MKEKGGSPGDEVATDPANLRAGALAELLGGDGFEGMGAPDHRAESRRPREVVDDLVARGHSAFRQRKLQLVVDNRHGFDFARVGKIERLAGDPFVQEPNSAGERARWRRDDEVMDGLRANGGKETRKDPEVDTLSFEGEHQLAGELRFGMVSRRQERPVVGRGGMMALGDGSKVRRLRKRQIIAGDERCVALRKRALGQAPSARIHHRL